ncbi:MAG: hypothetical protein RMN25_12375 [Anaerolineae bacterium]|nr:hypothetical protein [Thermoflexales bacterium]MDW8408566.1 hypothetical protein [Anaerolineae bacterium]
MNTNKALSQRTALLIAGGITAFTLVGIGALAGRLSANTPQNNVTTNSVAQTVEYNALVREANRRIEQANRQLAATAQQAQAAQASASAGVADTSSPAAQAPYSAEAALRLALASAPGSIALRLPELVSFQGVTAYEVVLDAGTLYIDANTGAVLYNGARTQQFLRDRDEDHDNDERDDHDDHDDHDNDHSKSDEHENRQEERDDD